MTSNPTHGTTYEPPQGSTLSALARAVGEYRAHLRELHRPLMDEVARLTGLTPMMETAGSGITTVVIPLSAPAPGEQWTAPFYVAGEDGRTDDGRWHGGASFYLTDADYEDGKGVDVVSGPAPRHPHEWARLIAEHYQAHLRPGAQLHPAPAEREHGTTPDEEGEYDEMTRAAAARAQEILSHMPVYGWPDGLDSAHDALSGIVADVRAYAQRLGLNPDGIVGRASDYPESCYPTQA